MTSTAFERLPPYLRRYTTQQDESRYTDADQAAWRYIMRQSRAYFRRHAVPIYLDGLGKTGITLDRIPLIADMDRKLAALGWGAVPVVGFIPPAAFLDFQARRVLPIACDMRSVDHIHYTPAPDIVHEAAGHAPILADREYSEYVTMYAAMAQKAIFARHDLDLYEAIRTLSDIKENPDSTPAMINAAEERLVEATAACQFVSEAAKVARMNWWTVEYGLLGSLREPKIYGAGLLSSVGESQTCLSPQVRKLRLSAACVEQTYNITEPQPQLFVAEDIHHLTAVLKEFEQTLAFRRGGVYGLNEAKSCETIASVVLGSGIEISGVVTAFVASGDRVDFVKLAGPSQLAFAGRQLAGQGCEQHPHGFSTPVGRWRDAADRDPARLDDDVLRRLGIVVGDRAELSFASGFAVRGRVKQLQRAPDGRLLIIKWSDCTMTRGDEIHYQPEWGDFDMAVGDDVVSVFGGPADRECYDDLDVGKATTSPARHSPFSDTEKQMFAQYRQLRAARTGSLPADARALAERAARDMPAAWLLRLECLELLKQRADPLQAAFVRDYEAALLADAERLPAAARQLLKQGVELAAVPD